MLHIPDYFRKALSGSAEVLLKKLLSLNVLITRRYTNRRVFEEVRGISHSSGVAVKDLLELNIFPELIKAACSVIGLWGPATATGRTLHMRALDWDRNFPINKYPLITVYFSSEAGSQAYANIGYLGLIGMLSGVSERLSIGEKVWLPPKNSQATTRYGEPWTYVLRNVMQFGEDLASANAILRAAHRTCTLHLGVASNVDHAFTMSLYSFKDLQVFDDGNYSHYSPVHPKMRGVAFFDKHVQPSGDGCLGPLLQQSYGGWTLADFWREVGLSHATGDTQLLVFDLEAQAAYLSYSEHGSGLEAYKRAPLYVDFADLFQRF